MADMDKRLAPNREEVVSKVIDGEAIIINLSNGVYYSIDRVGAEIWNMIDHEVAFESIVTAIADRYETDRSTVESDVSRLLSEFEREGIVLEVADASAASPSGTRPEPPDSAPGVYQPPRLEVYRDMGDLLALDPPQPGLENTPWKDRP